MSKPCAENKEKKMLSAAKRRSSTTKVQPACDNRKAKELSPSPPSLPQKELTAKRFQCGHVFHVGRVGSAD